MIVNASLDPATGHLTKFGLSRTIALVDSDDQARRALHLKLLGEKHFVRAYDGLPALVVDPKALEMEWVIVSALTIAVDLRPVRDLRSKGWRGRLVLIVSPGVPSQFADDFIHADDLVLTHPVGDHVWRNYLNK